MLQLNKDKLLSQLATALIITLVLAPCLLALLFIAKYGVNCLFIDQWAMVPLFDKLYSGKLLFGDLFIQAWEHRPLLPRVVMLALGSLTHYNNLAEMYFSWFLLCLTCLVLFKLFVRLFGLSRTTLVKFIPVSWLVFSLRQYENLLRGDQLAIFLEILLFLLTVYLLALSRRFDWRFLLAIVCAVACTFSLAGGLLVWPVALVQILCSNSVPGKRLWRLDIVKAAVWTCVGVAIYILYFDGYWRPAASPDPFYFMMDPYAASAFGIVVMGSPLSLDVKGALAVGGLILLLYIFIIGVAMFRPKMLTAKFPALSLVLFTVSVAIVLVVTRSGWGIERAFISWYTTMTTLGIIGLYTLVISLDFKNSRVKYMMTGCLIALIFAGVGPTADPVYLVIGNRVCGDRQTLAYYLATYKYKSDEIIIKYLSPSPEQVRQLSEKLEKNKLNVFSDATLSSNRLKPLTTEPTYHLDTIDDKLIQSEQILMIEANKEKTLRLTGWAIDSIGKAEAGGVLISVDGQIVIPAFCGLSRPDVAKYFNNDNYTLCGFEALLDTAMIGPGQHDLSIKVIAADGKAFYQPVKFLTMEIK